MISVRNHHLRLNGSNILFFVLFSLLVQSCGFLGPSSPVSKDDTPPDDSLPTIEGTRVYDPVKGEWVTVAAPPSDPMDTLTFQEASRSQIPPITMAGVEQYLPASFSGRMMDQYSMTLLLPFMANRVKPEDEEITNSVTQWSLHFYSGAQLALQELAREDVNLQLNVIDTDADPSRMENLLNSRPEINNAQVIVGPYRRENIRLAAEFAKRNRKAVFSPYSAASNLTEENPFFVQVNPSLFTHCENLLKHARNEFEPEEIILVCRDIAIEKQCIEAIQKEHFTILGTSFADSLRYTVMPTDPTAFFEMEIDSLFDEEDRIAFIVPSWADESFVYGLLRKIDLARDSEQEIVVYGLPQWMDYDHIDYEYYEKLNVRVSSSIFVNAQDERVKRFRRTFYDSFGTLPDNEAFLGYDLTYYLGKMLQKHGSGFLDMLDSESMELMHTRFEFQKVVEPTTTGAEMLPVERLENKYVNILEFNNYAFEVSNN